MSQPITCPICGASNRATAKICKQCGNALVSTRSAAVSWRALVAGQPLHSGEYRVVQPLGKGGMGAVYLVAKKIAHAEQRLVLKEMIDYWDPNDPQGPTKARQRFEDEAATLTQLSHPGIPKIFNYFTESIAGENRNFIVMEYVEGENLEKRVTHVDDARRMIRGGPSPVSEVLPWGIQLCKVLEYLAARQDERGDPKPIIHHDIKPANVILDKNSGDVRLVDFGTAKAELLWQAGGTVGKAKSSVYGTAGYAPPEQYDRGPNNPPHTEPRSDVYALAATLYHLLTDDDPRSHPFQFPQVSNLPPALQNVLQRALEGDVGKRLHAIEFRQQLEALGAPRVMVSIPFDTKTGRTITITDLQSLVAACDQYWDAATEHLFNRDLEVWLGQMQQTALVQEAEKWRMQHVADRDRALELLLEAAEQYNVTRPQRPKIETQPTTGIMWGELHQDTRSALTVKNVGKGYFFATQVTSSVPWLQVSPTQFAGNAPHQLQVATDLSKLPLDQPARGEISIITNGGSVTLVFQVTRVNARVYLERGARLFNAGQLEQALANFREVFNRDPSDAERAEAVAAVAILLSTLNRLPECYQWAEQEEPALEWMDPPKLHLAPAASYSIAYFCRVWADYLYRQKDTLGLERVVAWYARAAQLAPATIDATWVAQVHIELAQRYCDAGKFDEARAAWQDAARLNPQVAHNSILARRFARLAHDLVSRGQFEFALQRYQQAQAISPQDANVSELAAIYFEWAQRLYREDDLDGAIAAATHALNFDPNNAAAWSQIQVWQNYAASHRKIQTIALAAIIVLGIVAEVALAAAWAIQVIGLPSVLSIGALALSGVATFVFGIVFLLRQTVKRLLDAQFGGWRFVAGVVLSGLLWLIPIVTIGTFGGIVIARLSLSSIDQRPIWLVSWIGLGWLALFAWVTRQELGAPKQNALPRWATCFGVMLLAVVTAWAIVAADRGVGGLLAGNVFGCLIVSAATFNNAYLNGQGRSQDYWQPLFTPARVGLLLLVSFTAVLFAGWETMIDRTVYKVQLYEQAQTAVATDRLDDARIHLRELSAIDPNFADVATWLPMLYQVDLNASVKLLDADQATWGESRTYTIIVTNAGPDTAPNVVVTDVLPARLELLPQPLPMGVSRTGNTITWKGALDVGKSITIPLRVRVLPTPATSQMITNTIQIDSGTGSIINRHAVLRVVPTPTRTPTARPTPTRTPTPTPAPLKLTVGSENWSSRQGQGNWWYVEGRSGDWSRWSDMRWDPNLTLKYCLGGCWRSNFGEDFVRLDKFGGHPGLSNYIAKRWVSPISGQIRVSVIAYMVEGGGNGVAVRLIQNGSVLRTIYVSGGQTQASGASFDYETTIVAGGWLMLAVESNGNTDYDHTVFDMTIWQLP